MKKVKCEKYDAHIGYNAPIDQDLLNMKIRIIDEFYNETGKVFYEGSVGKFIKERIPSESLVQLITELKSTDKVSYQLSGCENYIERIK